jgi:hypothetical protein
LKGARRELRRSSDFGEFVLRQIVLGNVELISRSVGLKEA